MDFLLAVLTLPGTFAGEGDSLEGLLEAGVARLHLRKPEASMAGLEGLLSRLAPRWADRLVVHGNRELALRYGIPNVHGSVAYARGGGRSGGGPFVGAPAGLALSTSVHSWEEFGALPAGLAYAFISPLFDSISKKGYAANTALLRQPEEVLPCMPVGLGGIGVETIGELLRQGWSGAAVLGWIWEQPGAAVTRFKELKSIIDEHS